MKPISFAIGLWVKTVLFNAFFFGVVLAFKAGGWGLIAAMVCVFFGLIGSLPLLPFILILVKLSLRLPYAAHARLAWVGFGLCIQVFVFCIAFAIITQLVQAPEDTIDILLTTAICAALLATIASYSSFSKLIINSPPNQSGENAV